MPKLYISKYQSFANFHHSVIVKFFYTVVKFLYSLICPISPSPSQRGCPTGGGVRVPQSGGGVFVIPITRKYT